MDLSYGYVTKKTRIDAGLEKSHAIDARCITGYPMAEPLGGYYQQKKVRCHNRKLHKLKINKGGSRKNHQASKDVLGFKLFDRVRYDGNDYFVFGRRLSGYFDIRDVSGNKVNKGSVSNKKLKRLSGPTNILIKYRKVGGDSSQD